jgi:hypothetical protein
MGRVQRVRSAIDARRLLMLEALELRGSDAGDGCSVRARRRHLWTERPVREGQIRRGQRTGKYGTSPSGSTRGRRARTHARSQSWFEH